MKPREASPRAVPAKPAEIRDDPFARALAHGEGSGATAVERSATIVGPLAQRDPHAPADVSAEFDITGPISFDEVLRSARRRGFAAGVAAGAIAAIVGALAFGFLTAGPVAPPAEPPRSAEERRVPSAPTPVRTPVQTPAPPAARADRTPAPAATPAREGAARAAAQRPIPPPAVGPPPDVVMVPGLDLRTEETSAAAAEPPPSAAPSPPAPAPAPRRLDDAEVASALDARRPAIEGCIGDHRAEAAGAGGRRFHLVVTIAATGQVADARLDDAELGATALGACLAGVARGLAVPPFDGDPVRVELPLRFAGGN